MKKLLLFVLLIQTFLFSQIIISKKGDHILLKDVNQTQLSTKDQKHTLDPKIKKLLEKKTNDDSNLSKEDIEFSNKIKSTIETIGNVYNAKDNKQRDDLIRDLAGNYLSMQVNSLIEEYLHALNHSINSEFNLNYNDRAGLSGDAKVLLPIMSEDNPKISYFLQSGVGGYDNHRLIGHFGGGIRYYPNALTLENSGNIMLGLNSIYDYDFNREHKRISFGAEAMVDTLAFHANIYQRLSDWIDSFDFDKNYIQERPANGWDMGLKYAFPTMSNIAVFANISKWYGEKVAPFNNANSLDDLEKNPLIYEGGISYAPVPALNFSLSHKRSDKSDKQGTNIAMNFNIPLDYNAFKHAFDPKFAGLANTIEGSRTKFVDRDYSMVLEYRALPGKYHISYCGSILGTNTHCIAIKNGLNEVAKHLPVLVTPSQRSVIFKNGNNYITDDNGKIYVSIIHAYGVHKTNLNVIAGNSKESFPVTIIAPKSDFRIFAKPTAIQRFEKSMISFVSSDLASDADVVWKLIGKGSLEKTPNSDKTDKDGSSNIIYKPDSNMKDKEKVQIIAKVLGVSLKTFVQIIVYGDNDIILDKNTIGNKEIAHASYKNLQPNSTKIKWSIQGDNALFVNKEKTSKELNLIADENGESNVDIIGFDGNSKVKIIAKNMSDTLVKEKSKDLEIKNYKAIMELPTGKDPVTHQDFEKGMIDYKSDFEVKLKGLMPKTKVLWKAKDTQSNKTLKISSDKESTADDKGESKIIFEGVKDFNIKKLQIIATYNQSVASTQKVSGEIKLHQYTPSINFSKDKIHAYESDNNKLLKEPRLDHVEVTLKGGKPSEKIEWNLSGDATLSNQTLSFNEKGEAKATITAKAPFKTNPNLEVKSMANDIKKELPYEIKEYTPKVEGFSPKFEKEETLDYKTAFSVQVSNLLPHSKISVAKTQIIKPKKEEVEANDKGEATIEFEGIDDFNQKEISLDFEYIKKGDEKAKLAYTIKLHQYTPSINFSKDKIHAYESDNNKLLKEPRLDHVEVTLKGGKPSEKIEWNLSGDATLSNQTLSFNEKGEAKATITAKAPFKTNPNLEVKSMANDIKKELPYEIKEYTPKVEGFSPKFEKEETLDYKTAFSVQVSNLLPHSKISVAKTQIIKPKKEEVEANDKGEATIEFEGIDDFNQKEISLDFEYIKKGDEKAKLAYTIKLHQYTPSINFSKDKIHAYESDNNKLLKEPRLDHVEVTLKGGKPSEKIEWNLSGDATLSNQTLSFNEKGEAKATITAKAPFKTNPNLEVKSMANDIKKELPYEIKEYTPKVEGFSPKFEKEETLDYKTAFSVQVSNLLPHSKISVAKTQIIKPKKEEVEANDKGEATIEFEGIDDFNQKEISLDFEYIKKGDEKAKLAYTIKLHQYTPSINFSKDKIHAYESDNNKLLKEPRLDHVEVTLKGGKPSEKIEWNLSGDATLSNQTLSFNEKGEAKATITAKAPFKTNPNLEVKSMANDIKKELPYEIKEYTPKVEGFSPKFEKEETLDYKTAFSVQVSNLLPHSKISVAKTQIIKPKKEEVEANDKGEATIEFEGIDDFNQKEISLDFEYIKKGDEKAKLAYTIKLHQYTPSINFSKDKIHAYESDNNKLLKEPRLDHVEVTLKGGKPSEKIEWNLSGDATLSNQTLSFNEKGEAKATITAKAPFKTNPNLEVKSMANDIKKELPYEIKEYTPKVEGFSPKFEKEETLDYKTAFSVQVSNLLPHSKISVAKTQIIKPKKEEVEANDKGEATIEFEGIDDFNQKEISLDFEYIKKGDEKAKLAYTIKLHQYTPSINFSKDKIHAYESDNNKLLKEPRLDHVEVTLKGGKPSEKIEWNLSGDATLSNQTLSFNEKGEAKATITAKAPFKTNPTINVNTLGQNLSKTITYDVKTYTPSVKYPSFKDQEKTIDYIDDFNIKISGLLPNSTIDKISGSKGVKAKKESFNVNNKGEATLEFEGISDYSVKELTIKFSYIKQGSVKEELNLDKIKLYRYTISFNANPSTIIAEPNKNAEVTLKGGKANEKIEWSLSGDATLTKADKVFNTSGEAKATITSKTPFKANPIIIVKAMGKNLTKTLTYIDGTIYTPKIEYPSFKDQEKTIDYIDDFNIKISGLLPNSTIDKISGSKGVKAKKESFNVNNKGEATLEFEGISDYSVKELTIKFSYIKQGSVKEELNLDKIKLYRYTISFNANPSTIIAEPNKNAEVTLKGGKANEKIEWSLSGDATLTKADKVFNTSGEAKATITSKTPFKANPIIIVKAMGKNLTKTLTYIDGTIYTPKIEYPSFKDQEKTIDYIDDFNIKISGLLPNSTIDKISGSKGVKAKKESFNVNNKGEATLEFEGISDYSVKELTIKFSYIKQGSVKEELNLDKIKLYRYTISFNANPSTIIAEPNKNAEVTLKGGKANEKIEWSLSGDATLTKADKVFNTSGEAKATITSKTPFKANPIIIVKAMGNDIKKELPYEKKNPISLTFSKSSLNPHIYETVNVVARGIPGAKIKWSITGDATLPPKKDLIPKNFDNTGFARTKFRTINSNIRPVTVSVEYEDGSGKASKMIKFNGPIRLKISSNIILFGEEKTIELYGLVPNSTVEVQPDQYLGYVDFVNKGTLYSDNIGSVYLKFKPIEKVTQHTGRVFNLKVKYKEWDGTNHEAILGSIEVKKIIQATYDTEKDPNSCYTSATLTVTGGIPGEKIDFDGTKLNVGLGQTAPVTQRWDEEFDNSGEAKVIISTTWCTKPLTETPTFKMRFNTLGVDETASREVTFGGGDHERIY
ncbi:inverse autotransporter beta-barrel domain-containing protein [Campylobacter peloridis]|uniref:Inverse autotransporter beta-barrel domain-containing protein n=1 Tax=Campylobacter peloridis TaxID=488546 RepID=A0ABX6TU87_9BACT|nr:inverse autotransporter beta-barrel domain-containing protein [Campylobacter peloridis]AJC84012.1 hypothetical protein (DUF3442 domain) [Campylobacter peloridis LMG 23910]QOQ89603.1 inverse autotransporter beta-barrel domain-containing protein [Campylobacter peloridis]